MNARSIAPPLVQLRRPFHECGFESVAPPGGACRGGDRFDRTLVIHFASKCIGRAVAVELHHELQNYSIGILVIRAEFA